MFASDPVIGLLVLNHNGKHWLPSLFDSIRANGYRNVRVYLVDNASEDASVDFTLEHYAEVTVIRMPQDLGYCMAYNLSMPHAFADGCEWVVWANNDTLLEAGCLHELAKAVGSDIRIGVAGPAFRSWEGEEPNYYMTGKHPELVPAMQSRSSVPADVDWVEGSFLMVGRHAAERVGPLDPGLFAYWEEADYCRRARWLGWRVVLVPSALARHHGNGTSSGKWSRSRSRWLRSRNYYIYKLTNPAQSYVENLLDASHLFIVNLKAGITNPSLALPAEIRAFSSALLSTKSLRDKWLKVRAGVPPPPTSEKFKHVRPEVLHAAAL